MNITMKQVETSQMQLQNSKKFLQWKWQSRKHWDLELMKEEKIERIQL
jgi:hypothetical protein